MAFLCGLQEAECHHPTRCLPTPLDSLDALANSLDLVSGYWQVSLDPDAQERSAFATRAGLWKWKVDGDSVAWASLEDTTPVSGQCSGYSSHVQRTH